MKKLVNNVNSILEALAAVEAVALRLGFLILTLAILFEFIRHALHW